MATFRNDTQDTLSLGKVLVPPSGTVIETEQDTNGVRNVQYFYELDKLTLVSGTPDFSAAAEDTGGFSFMSLSALDCALNPNYPSTNLPYRISVAGKIGGASGVQVYVNDIIAPIANNAGGTQAAVGSSWVVLHNHSSTLDIDAIDLSAATYSVPWGISDVTVQQDITASTTLTNISGLVQTGLLAGKRYNIAVTLFVANTINNGIKLAFATPDTLTATTFIATADSYSSVGAIVSHSKITSLTGTMCADTAVVERVDIYGTIVVNAAGTLRLQIAQNASHADTLSVLVGSNMRVVQVQV